MKKSKTIYQTKKAVSHLVVIMGAIIMALLVAAISIYLITKAPTKVGPLENYTNQTYEFQPYNATPKDDDRIVYDSLHALIDSINYLVTGKLPEQQKSNQNKAKPIELNIESVNVYYVGKIELEESGFMGRNSYRLWMFNKTLKVTNTTPNIIPDYVIFADYTYGSCPTKGMTSHGKCLSIDRPERRKVRRDISTNIAAVRDIVPLYNIMIEVKYKDGKTCKISTSSSTNINELIKLDRDLLVWGAPTVCRGGCDRNGDGIRGYYLPRYFGKPYEEVLTSKEKTKLEQLSAQGVDLISRYFPDGKVSEKSSQGCLDSPTWVECPGVRVFYCGKWGYSKWADTPSEYYYITTPDGKVHARAGAKFYLVFSEKLKGDGFGGGISSANQKGSNKIKIRDSKGKKIKDFVVGSFNYAKSFALPIYSIAITAQPAGAITYATLKKFLGSVKDPVVFCNQGNDYGSNVKLRCDGLGCVVCNFQLPQKNAGSKWLAGYGDPKYVVYYEAFPEGEEEAWRIDLEQAALISNIQSIIIWNIVAHSVTFIGGQVISKVKKFGSKLSRIVGLSHIKKVRKVAKLGEEGIENMPKSYMGYLVNKKLARPIKESVTKVIRGLTEKIDNIIVSGKKTALKLNLPKVNYKLLLDDSNPIKYMSKTDLDKLLKAAGKNFDDFITDVVKHNDKELQSLVSIAKEQGLLPSALKITSTRIPKAIIKKSPEYALTAIILFQTLKLDSMNEKFLPIGINAIGMKKPYYGAYVSGKDLPKLDEKASAYYLALVRDKYGNTIMDKVLLNQPTQRFYLASPCRAHLLVVRTRCQCYAPPPKYGFVEIDQNYKRLAGNEPDIITSDPDTLLSAADLDQRYKYGVKYCFDYTQGMSSLKSLIEKPIYKPRCIKIDPIILDNTFCYGGNHAIEEIMQISLLVANIGASIATEAAATTLEVAGSPTIVVPVVVEGLQTVVDIGIDLATLGLETLLAKHSKWPNH